MIKKGDYVVLKDPFWHHGNNLGGRIGLVENDFSTLSIIVSNYDDNPVKAFRNEVTLLNEDDDQLYENDEFNDLTLDDINDILDNWVDSDTDPMKVP